LVKGWRAKCRQTRYPDPKPSNRGKSKDPGIQRLTDDPAICASIVLAEEFRGGKGLKALRQLALDRDTTVQDLMIEAANDLLRKYRRRPVAQTAR